MALNETHGKEGRALVWVDCWLWGLLWLVDELLVGGLLSFCGWDDLPADGDEPPGVLVEEVEEEEADVFSAWLAAAVVVLLDWVWEVLAALVEGEEWTLFTALDTGVLVGLDLNAA